MTVVVVAVVAVVVIVVGSSFCISTSFVVDSVCCDCRCSSAAVTDVMVTAFVEDGADSETVAAAFDTFFGGRGFDAPHTVHFLRSL
jgi:hypothetical protein